MGVLFTFSFKCIWVLITNGERSGRKYTRNDMVIRENNPHWHLCRSSFVNELVMNILSALLCCKFWQGLLSDVASVNFALITK